MSALTGMPRLLRLALRRDRVVLPVWIVAIAGLLAGTAASVTSLYTSVGERVAAATFSASNPIIRVFDGPAAGTDTGALVLMEIHWLLAALTGLLCAQAVVRHTRAEEESGRAELVEAAVVGRHARLTAALKASGLAAIGVGASAALVLVAFDLPVAGALLTGATLTGVGGVFGCVAAVAAQLTSSARAANGVTGAALGVAFLLRAVGDAAGRVEASGTVVSSAWPSWLSPIGWAQQARAFGDERWWVLLLFAATCIVLVSVAYVCSQLRDVGAGMVAARPGPSAAPARTGTPLGLAWRLHRGSVLAWSVTMAIVGTAFGAVGDSAEDLAGVSDDMRAALEAMAPGGGIVDLYFAFAVGLAAFAASGFAVQALLRVRAEELAGRSEAVLGAAVSRHRWLASHAAIAAVGTAWLLLVLGVTGALSYGWLTGSWAVGFEGMLGAALVHLPAALVLAAVVLLAIALTPRWAAAVGWGALAASLVMGQLGALLELPQPVLRLSPFTHVPAVPAQPLEVLPLVLLSLVAAAIGAAAFAVHRRRDLVLTA